MDVVNLTVVLTLISIAIVASSKTDTADQPELKQELTLSSNKNSIDDGSEYGEDFKDRLHQFGNFMHQEAMKFDDGMGADFDADETFNNDVTRRNTKRPFVMSGGHYFGKRHDVGLFATNENLDDSTIYPHYNLQTSDVDDEEDTEDNDRVANEFLDGNFVTENEGSLVIKNFKLSKSLPESDVSPYGFSYDLGNQYDDDDMMVERKRPFVLSGNHRYGKFGKRAKRPFVFTGGYGFGKRYPVKSYPLNVNKRPFVLSGSHRFGKFGKRSLMDGSYLSGIKKPFVFDDRYFLNKTKRPFVLGGHHRIGKFGKRKSNDDNYLYEMKRPFVLGGGYHFGKRYIGNEEGIEERKRPPVFNSGYIFGKHYVGDRLGHSHKNNKDYNKLTGNAIENAGPFELDYYRLEKRPFVMSGSFNRYDRQPRPYRSLPFTVGSGFRFGKRQHWKDNYLSFDTKNEDFVDYKSIDLQDAGNGNEDHHVLSPKAHYVDKRPFVMIGSNHKTQPVEVKNSWERPMMIGSGFRFGKRQSFKHANDPSEDTLFDSKQKRPLMMSYGKREREINDFLGEADKRSFTFRNDYYLNKLRQKTKTNTDKRSLYLDSFGKRPYSPNESQQNTERYPDEHSTAHLNDEDRNDYYDKLETDNEIVILPFHSVKRPFMTSGTYRHKIGKRPFVIGSNTGYRFGK